MSKLKIEQGDWIVVCDGAKALVLENVGDDKFPSRLASSDKPIRSTCATRCAPRSTRFWSIFRSKKSSSTWPGDARISIGAPQYRIARC